MAAPITLLAGDALTQAFIDSIVQLKDDAETAEGNAATSESNAANSASAAQAAVSTILAGVSNYSVLRAQFGCVKDTVDAAGMTGYTIDDFNGDWDSGILHFGSGNLTGDITLLESSTNLDGVSHICFFTGYETAVANTFDLVWTVSFINSGGDIINFQKLAKIPILTSTHFTFDPAGAGAESHWQFHQAEFMAVPAGTTKIKLAGVAQASASGRSVLGNIWIVPGPFSDGS